MFSGFMTNAWLAGTVVAAVAGVVGLFVVMRGGAFAAHAIPNGAFAGAAAAYWLGTNELLGLGIAAGASALAIGSLGQRNRRDVATALVLVLLLASGALFLSLSGGYEPEVYGLLFGEILGVSSTQLLPVTLVGLGCVVVVALAWRPLLLSTVLPDVAEARGVRLRVTEIAFLLVVAAATTVTLPVVGALLIFSLMIGPPAAAALAHPAAGARARPVGGLRARDRLARHRQLVLDELARGLLRRLLRRGVLRRRAGGCSAGPVGPAPGPQPPNSSE